MKLVLGALVATFLITLSAGAETTTKKSSSKPAAKAPAKAAAKPEAQPTSIRGVPVISRDPYLGMIAVDGATGQVLAEDNADARVFPASVIKLMNLFVVLDRVQQGSIKLTDPITATAEVTKLGGSQVYLKEGEVFTVEDLIYALMVQSANDAAGALAIHAAGTQAAFVELMNQKAQALGLTQTRFYSCHGLPPTPPRTAQQIDTSTPRDLAVLARALVSAHPDVIQYTSTKERTFRQSPLFVMRNHNHRLMASSPGVDGLKTGYIQAGGYSTVVTAKRSDRRVFVVVCGSRANLGKARDKAAAEILNKAFAALPPAPPPPPPQPPATNLAAAAAQRDPTSYTPEPESQKDGNSNWRTAGLVLGIIVLGGIGMAAFFAWRRKQNDDLPDARHPPRHLPHLHR
jgi:D-alanyl-D-alanine carboxypeptidase (penicillin-binding protein 5/6)